MLDPKIIRQDVELVAKQLKTRGFIFDKLRFNALEEQRKKLQMTLQELQNERNVQSKAVGLLKAKGESIDAILSQVKELGEDLNATQAKFEQVQSELNEFLALIPNIPHPTVPEGKSEEDNVVMRTWGVPKKFDFVPKDHVDLGAPLGMDFAAAAKISGARFVVLNRGLARLQRGLAQLMLDLHIKEHGYHEIYVPFIVNAESLYGTGQLPKLKEDLFALKGEQEFYLIPTSESPITNIVRQQIVEADQLPLKFVAQSACFRSEAGSYGKDTRGMLRQHQFEKVELVQVVHPEESYRVLEELTSHAEKVLQRLELPYRVVSLCTADLGFAAAKTYDLEVWLPGQNRYREISSCSNTESFQARRMMARYRDANTGKPELVHTLNGSGLAVGRTLIAILENYQDEQGRIHIPSALVPYVDGLRILES